MSGLALFDRRPELIEGFAWLLKTGNPLGLEPLRNLQTMIEDQQRPYHRLWTYVLTATVLGVMIALTFVAPVFTEQLNQFFVLRFPAGFYLAAQGAVVIFVVLLFWAAGRQESVDRKFGAAEDN